MVQVTRQAYVSTVVNTGLKTLLCVIALAVSTASPAAENRAGENLEPTIQQQKTVRLVTTVFERSHYSHPRIDDALSSRILDRYLDALDPNRVYLTKKNVESFERYRRRLDQAVRRGDVEPVFEIFRRYRTRLRSSIEQAIKELDTEPDFNIDERYYFDRSEASWAADQAELAEIWRKRVKNDVLSLILAGRDWQEAAEILRKRYNSIVRRIDQLTSDEVFESFMNAYGDSLDPHSNYFSPRTSEEYRIHNGIGASLNLTHDYVTVVDVVPGGPAAIDGRLQERDRIAGVGQGDEPEIIDVVGWSLDDVIQLIRGPSGSIVRLQILAADVAPGSAEQIVELKRGKVTLEAQAAQKRLIDVNRGGGRRVLVGVIDIPSFYQDFKAKTSGDENYTSMTSDVSRLISELRKKPIGGLVLDLRGNGGGHLSEALALTGLFINKRPFLQIRDAAGRIEVLPAFESVTTVYSGPLAVLVDRNSAGASEIFAAAIQDHGRGLVLGQETFGMGSAQNLYDLNRYVRDAHGDFGQLTVTIGAYFRINGEALQKRGVVPDIRLPSAIDINRVGETTYKTALPADQIRSIEFEPLNEFATLIGDLYGLHVARTLKNPVFQDLLREINHLNVRNAKRSVSLNFEERRAAYESEQLSLDKVRATRKIPALDGPITLESAEQHDIVLAEAIRITTDIVQKLASQPAPAEAQ